MADEPKPADPKAGKINVMFVLYQCQMWINRSSLVNLLRDQITFNEQMLDIFGPVTGKSYSTAIDTLTHIIDLIKALDPEKGENLG